MFKTRVAAAAAALLVAGAVLSVAGPAFADETTTTSTSTTLGPCTPGASAPLYTARCAPQVQNSGGQVTVTLPGVGSLTFLVNPDGTVNTSTAPSVSVIGNNFSGGTPKVSFDGTHISVSFVNIASPQQHYSIKVKLSPPSSAGGAPTVSAVAGPNTHKGHHGHGDDRGGKDDNNDRDDQGDQAGGDNPAPLVHAGTVQSSGPGADQWSGHGHGGGGD